MSNQPKTEWKTVPTMRHMMESSTLLQLIPRSTDNILDSFYKSHRSIQSIKNIRLSDQLDSIYFTKWYICRVEIVLILAKTKQNFKMLLYNNILQFCPFWEEHDTSFSFTRISLHSEKNWNSFIQRWIALILFYIYPVILKMYKRIN